MEPLTLGLLLGVVAVVIGRTVGREWIVGQVKSGRIARRTAIWLVSTLTIVPYVLLFLWVIVSDPSLWWMAILLFVASWPVIALPLILVIHTTAETKSR